MYKTNTSHKIKWIKKDEKKQTNTIRRTMTMRVKHFIHVLAGVRFLVLFHFISVFDTERKKNTHLIQLFFPSSFPSAAASAASSSASSFTSAFGLLSFLSQPHFGSCWCVVILFAFVHVDAALRCSSQFSWMNQRKEQLKERKKNSFLASPFPSLHLFTFNWGIFNLNYVYCGARLVNVWAQMQ